MARSKTILIVDDEPGMARALAAILEDSGFRVETAADGNLALQRLEDDLPDAVLLDFLMPHRDGCQTLRAIRDSERLASLRVAMMSGVSESMVRRKCGSRRYDAFLQKPFSLDQLLALVRKLVATPRARPNR